MQAEALLSPILYTNSSMPLPDQRMVTSHTDSVVSVRTSLYYRVNTNIGQRPILFDCGPVMIQKIYISIKMTHYGGNDAGFLQYVGLAVMSGLFPYVMFMHEETIKLICLLVSRIFSMSLYVSNCFFWQIREDFY